MKISITHIGTATVILEIGSLRILTDPALEAAGKHYAFAFGTGSTKTQEPVFPPHGLGEFDAVLLSHHQHADNLDDAGLEVLRRTPVTLSTRGAAAKLGSPAVGLEPWQSHELGRAGGTRLRVTATPARHGPPLSLPFVGPVVGFIIEGDGLENGPLYISGDTVWFPGVAEVARRFKVGTALLHVGGVQFGISGPIRYTFDGAEAAMAAAALHPKLIIPLHYEGWTHFAETREATAAAFEQAGLAERVRWLERGAPTPIDA
jgi:L-ascorbate metabolism protein UlaG (beta-lactamase superfamily)